MPPVDAIIGNFVHRSSNKFGRFLGYHFGIGVSSIETHERRQV